MILINKSICTSDSKNKDNDALVEYFALDTYDEENKFKERHHLHFDFNSYYFDSFDQLLYLTNINYSILCSKDDIDKDDSEKNIITLWNTSVPGLFYSCVIYYNAFPIWFAKHKSANSKPFCLRIDSKGWNDNSNEEICKENKPCPDFIILDTLQLTQRYSRNETMPLNRFFRNYYIKNGISIESMPNKYSYYDYHTDNSWLGLPLSADFRILKFNITTFDYCIKKGYDLHYPPPLSDYWGPNYQETWTWEKAFEYAKLIHECTNKPGFKILTNYKN